MKVYNDEAFNDLGDKGRIDIPVTLFRDRIATIHQISQLGFVSVTIAQGTEQSIITRIRDVVREYDSFCIYSPGVIVILVSKLKDISGVGIIVKKITRALIDLKEMIISGVFIPFPILDLGTIVGVLKHGGGIAVDDKIKLYQKAVCQQCNIESYIESCVLRDTETNVNCMGPLRYKQTDKGQLVTQLEKGIAENDVQADDQVCDKRKVWDRRS